MKPIEELNKNIREGFKLVPVIKLISNCKSVLALETLKTQIDERISELKQKG